MRIVMVSDKIQTATAIQSFHQPKQWPKINMKKIIHAYTHTYNKCSNLKSENKIKTEWIKSQKLKAGK